MISETNQVERTKRLNDAESLYNLYIKKFTLNAFVKNMEIIGEPFLGEGSFLREWVEFYRENAQELQDLNQLSKESIADIPFLRTIRTITLTPVGDAGDIKRALENKLAFATCLDIQTRKNILVDLKKKLSYFQRLAI